MPHTDPVILALMALGEHAGAAQDDAHTAQCADCQLELERLTRLVELARRDGPALIEQPPASVWERIAAATGEAPGPVPVDAVLPIPGQPPATAAANGSGSPAGQPGRSPDAAGPPPRPARRRRRRPRLGVAVAGLVAGVVIGIGGTVAVTQLTRPPQSQVAAEAELRPLPQYPQWEGAAGTAVLRDTTAAQQLTVTLTAPQRPGFYEVWLLGQDGTSMISLGDLNAANTGTFTLPPAVNLSFYSRIDVSLQPFDGSTQHSGTSVVRGPLPAKADSAA